MTVHLYDCPPLSARITERQCEANAKRAEKAATKRASNPYRIAATAVLRACPGCPGVVALARGRAPNEVHWTRQRPEPESNRRRVGVEVFMRAHAERIELEG